MINPKIVATFHGKTYTLSSGNSVLLLVDLRTMRVTEVDEETTSTDWVVHTIFRFHATTSDRAEISALLECLQRTEFPEGKCEMWDVSRRAMTN